MRCLSEKDIENLLQEVYLPLCIPCVPKAEAVTRVFNCGVCAVSTPVDAKETENVLKNNLITLVSSIAYRNSLNKEIVRINRDLIVK